MADLAFPSIEEAEVLLGISEPEKAAERYLEMGAGVVVVKLGAQGALIASSQGMQRIEPVAIDMKDSSGAGDTFAGAFVVAYLEGRSLEWCGRFAVAASGLSTSGLGAVAPIPARARILECMERRSE